MSGRDILPIAPSSANLALMKQKITAATVGHSLLKRKRDALESHLRRIVNESQLLRSQIEEVMREASFSMVRAKFLATDFRIASVQQPDMADTYVNLKPHKIIDINVPSMELVLQPVTSLPLIGLAGGGQQLEIVRTKYQAVLKLLLEIASLELNIGVVAEAVKLNSRRVNTLEYVVVKYQRTLKYIRDELDEFDREDFYRLKRSHAKQQNKKSEFRERMYKRTLMREEWPKLDVAFMDFNKTAGIGNIGLRGQSMGVRRRISTLYKANSVELEDEETPFTVDDKKIPLRWTRNDDDNETDEDVLRKSSSTSI